MLKKTLSMILALAMIVGVLTVLPLSAGAAQTELADEGAAVELAQDAANADLAETGGLSLQGLIQKFPEGKYWNHKLVKGSGSRWEDDPYNNPDGWTDHPCYSHGSDVPKGEYKCNSSDWGIQCYGFAAKIAEDVYGSYFEDWKTVNVKYCKPGDVITYTHRSVYSGTVNSHTFMVIGREGNTIRIGECNFDRHCMITWSRTADVSAYTDKSAEATCFSAPYELPSFTMDTPKLIKAVNSADGVTVSWKAVGGAPKYRVYYKGGSVKSWKALADTAATSYLFKKAVYKTAYTFTVRAFDDQGKIASDYDRKGVSVTYLFAPKVAAAASPDKVVLTWDANGKAAKFRVYAKGGQYSKYTRLTDTPDTTYTFTSGNGGASYVFAVRCMSADNQFISDGGTTPAVKFTLSAPVVTKLQGTAKGIQLTWTARRTASKYRVFIKRETGWKKAGDTDKTSFTFTGAAAGENCIFTVRCLSADGKKYISEYNKNGWSLTFTAAPKITKTASAADGVHLTWNAVPGAEKYRVFVKSGSGWKKLGDTEHTSIVHTGAKSGTKYTYTVRCITADGKSYQGGYNTTGWSITYKKP